MTAIVGTFQPPAGVVGPILIGLEIQTYEMADLLIYRAGYQVAEALDGLLSSGLPALVSGRILQQAHPASTGLVVNVLRSAGHDLSSAGGYLSNGATSAVNYVASGKWLP